MLTKFSFSTIVKFFVVKLILVIDKRLKFNSSLDDIAVVSKDRFYVTNMHFFKDANLRTAELYLALPFGNIVYFDGQKSRMVDQWVATPTGIAVDKSRK